MSGYLYKIGSISSYYLTRLWKIVDPYPMWWPDTTMGMSDADLDFCKRMLKIELHAHITGSITAETLHEVWQEQKLLDPNFDLEDPMVFFANARSQMDPGRFFSLFSKYVYRLNNTKARIQRCTRSVLIDFKNDGVDYLELRSIPRAAHELSKEEYIQIVLAVLNEKAPNHPTISYLILGIDRKNTHEEALDTVQLAIKYRTKGVVGVDLSGNDGKCEENVQTFAEHYKLAHDNGLKVTLHFAENQAKPGREKVRDDELQALLSYNPDRLGHAQFATPSLREKIEERRIGLEICVSSNMSLQSTKDYSKHHFTKWWPQTKCPLAICTDDSGIFGTTLSQEYLLLMQNFGLSRKDVIQVARSSIECIFGTEDDKRMLRDRINRFEIAFFVDGKEASRVLQGKKSSHNADIT